MTEPNKKPDESKKGRNDLEGDSWVEGMDTPAFGDTDAQNFADEVAGRSESDDGFSEEQWRNAETDQPPRLPKTGDISQDDWKVKPHPSMQTPPETPADEVRDALEAPDEEPPAPMGPDTMMFINSSAAPDFEVAGDPRSVDDVLEDIFADSDIPAAPPSEDLWAGFDDAPFDSTLTGSASEPHEQERQYDAVDHDIVDEDYTPRNVPDPRSQTRKEQRRQRRAANNEPLTPPGVASIHGINNDVDPDSGEVTPITEPEKTQTPRRPTRKLSPMGNPTSPHSENPHRTLRREPDVDTDDYSAADDMTPEAVHRDLETRYGIQDPTQSDPNISVPVNQASAKLPAIDDPDYQQKYEQFLEQHGPVPSQGGVDDEMIPESGDEGFGDNVDEINRHSKEVTDAEPTPPDELDQQEFDPSDDVDSGELDFDTDAMQDAAGIKSPPGLPTAGDSAPALAPEDDTGIHTAPQAESPRTLNPETGLTAEDVFDADTIEPELGPDDTHVDAPRSDTQTDRRRDETERPTIFSDDDGDTPDPMAEALKASGADPQTPPTMDTAPAPDGGVPTPKRVMVGGERNYDTIEEDGPVPERLTDDDFELDSDAMVDLDAEVDSKGNVSESAITKPKQPEDREPAGIEAAFADGEVRDLGSGESVYRSEAVTSAASTPELRPDYNPDSAPLAGSKSGMDQTLEDAVDDIPVAEGAESDDDISDEELQALQDSAPTYTGRKTLSDDDFEANPELLDEDYTLEDDSADEFDVAALTTSVQQLSDDDTERIEPAPTRVVNRTIDDTVKPKKASRRRKIALTLTAVGLLSLGYLATQYGNDKPENTPIVAHDNSGTPNTYANSNAGDINPNGTQPQTQPAGNTPGSDNPGGNNPGSDNPGGDNPGGNNPGSDNPGGDNPGGDNPGGDNPGGDTTPRTGTQFHYETTIRFENRDAAAEALSYLNAYNAYLERIGEDGIHDGSEAYYLWRMDSRYDASNRLDGIIQSAEVRNDLAHRRNLARLQLNDHHYTFALEPANPEDDAEPGNNTYELRVSINGETATEEARAKLDELLSTYDNNLVIGTIAQALNISRLTEDGKLTASSVAEIETGILERIRRYGN